ncbi:hypothetical protein Pmani_010248 [Petrolisthes manimaculis]|uniref:GAIN-B domain-containing protein n=1 Tax=Petrolisthes manimaculis TaxID=1843537 RepID=A0AAE1UFS5_9EUCA|nr:hypothetical protein Pmani_010248 [Petrolisthes manimaculis]
MLSSVDKFSITSMDEVLQVNNILGSIADPLPKESQEGAVAALKTLAGAADSTAPLAQQKDFAAGALATTASLLTGVNKNVKKGNGTSEKRAEKMVAMARRRLRRSIWNQTEDEEEEEVEEEYLPSEEDEDANKKVSLTLESWMVVCQWVLAWSSSELNGSLEHTENLLYFNELNYHPDTGFYELFLDSETIGEATGTYSIGIGHYNMTEAVQEEHPCFEDPPPGTFIYSFATGFNESYSFSSFVSSCLFFNKETLSWSSEGCRVVGANTTITTCACNHLTSFGSGFFVAPNAIDFSYVFANAGFLDNLTIYLTLIISLALYFIGLVYARIKDRRDVEKVGVIPLADNEPSDQYLYVLIVHTGHIPKSKVQFLIAGDWEESDVRTLNEAETSRPLLTRGSVDHYLMATSRPLPKDLA